MTDADVRSGWLRYCEETSDRAAASKDPNAALPVIAARYAQISNEERTVVDELLVGLIEPDESVSGEPWSVGESARFLPLFLIREFGIVSALPRLRVLADWLESQDTPGAPYEWAKVNRIIGALVEGGTRT
jgi:hypothetical protein